MLVFIRVWILLWLWVVGLRVVRILVFLLVVMLGFEDENGVEVVYVGVGWFGY